MMDKKSVNNEITSMRNEVQRAKVHVINKLVRESRKLKMKRGTDQQREKYSKKADRLAELILLIKKLKKDAVSKFALMNTRSTEEILSDVSLPLEVKALARLSAHKNIASRVTNFRALFPDWETELPVLITKLGSKKKRKKKSSEELSYLLSNGQITSNNKNSIEENKPGRYVRAPCLLDEVEAKSVDSLLKTTKDSESEDEKSGSEISESSTQPLPVKVVSKSRLNTTKVKSKNKAIAEVKRFSDILNKEIESEDFDTIDDVVESFLNERKLKDEPEDLKNLNHTKNSRTQLKIKEDPEDELVHASAVDPFFMTEDGEDEYVSVAVKDPCEKNSSSELAKPQPSPLRKSRLQNNKYQSKVFQFKDHDAHHPRNRRERRLQEFQKAKSKASPFENKSAVKEPEVLHPSWEAKRKLKEIQITSFQGKKIKFDD